MAHRPSDDASICLAIRIFCQFTSSDVKAIPAAFIETTYSITVTAKRIKQKMTAPPLPPPPFKMPKRADPQGTPRQRHEELTYKSKVPFLKENPCSLKWLNNIFVII